MSTETTTKNETLGLMDQVAERALDRVWDAIEDHEEAIEFWGVNIYDLTITAEELSDILRPVGGSLAALETKALVDDVTDAILTSVPDCTGIFKVEGEELKIHVERLWRVETLQVYLHFVALGDPEAVKLYRAWKMNQIDVVGDAMAARLCRPPQAPSE